MDSKKVRVYSISLLLASMLLFASAAFYGYFQFFNIGKIKTGPEDPLEVWSEASYIVWKYNSTHYAARNMSTLLVDELGTSFKNVTENVINAVPLGGLIYFNVDNATEGFQINRSVASDFIDTLHISGRISVDPTLASPLSTLIEIVYPNPEVYNVRFHKLYLDCNKKVDTAVLVRGSVHSFVDVGIYDFNLIGIRLGDATRKATQTQIIGSDIVGNIDNSSAVGIYVDSSDQYITRTVIHGTRKAGIEIAQDAGFVFAQNVHIYRHPYTAGGIQHAILGGGRGLWVTNSYLESTTQEVVKITAGMELSRIYLVDNFLWAHQLTADNTYDGIFIDAGTYGITDARITGNHIIGTNSSFRLRSMVNITGTITYKQLQIYGNSKEYVVSNGVRSRATKTLTIPAGSTSVTWNHDLYTEPFVAIATPNQFVGNYSVTKSATAITVTIETGLGVDVDFYVYAKCDYA